MGPRNKMKKQGWRNWEIRWKAKKKEKEKEEWEGIRKWGGNGEKMVLLWYHVRIYGIEMEKREKKIEYYF